METQFYYDRKFFFWFSYQILNLLLVDGCNQRRASGKNADPDVASCFNRPQARLPELAGHAVAHVEEGDGAALGDLPVPVMRHVAWHDDAARPRALQEEPLLPETLHGALPIHIEAGFFSGSEKTRGGRALGFSG